ncbi:MAG: hypothetical protein AAGC43_11260 [Bacteroidota bacterium]
MGNTYNQRMTIDGHRIVITYNFREVWQKLMNGHMQPPVVVKIYPEDALEKKALLHFSSKVSTDIIFIIREYISVVRKRFIGIDFKYELVNHSIRYQEDNTAIAYYRAELDWYYSY